MIENAKSKKQNAKKIFYVILTLLILVVCYLLPATTYADELEEIEKKLGDLKHALELSRVATAPLESTLSKLRSQLTDIQNRVSLVEKEVARKEKEVHDGEAVLADTQDLLAERVRTFYIRSSFYNPITVFFSKKQIGEWTRELVYQDRVTREDKDTITDMVIYLKDLEEKKRNLEIEKARLAKLKEEMDKQATFLSQEVGKAKVYQTKLEGEIANLTARQKDILAQKLAGLNLPTSLGAGPLYCTDDRKIDPGFSPAFAAFTFGIPHRVGMNQYGAYGRAKSGQSYQEILRAYFDNVSFEKKDPNMKIKVAGFGEKNLDEYLLGIYEMPASWPIEAQKAQAVAARSYVMAYTGNGAKEICTTQACQVYKGGNKGGDWEKAVRETEGMVLVSGGQVVSAWYASTSGGYTFTSSDVGWGSRSWTKRLRDTNGDVGSFSDLFDRAYDKDSPCFYAAQGFRREYNKSAWLKPGELADIANVLLLAKQDSSVQNHLSQVDKPNPDNVETWNQERVRDELRQRGITPFSNVTNISVDWDRGVGRTTSVAVSGDGGSQSFSPDEFRNYFNLRAPANIQIVGPLFNFEKK